MFDQGCLQDLISWGGIRGGTWKLTYNIKVLLENLGAKPHFLEFALGLSVPAGKSPAYHESTVNTPTCSWSILLEQEDFLLVKDACCIYCESGPRQYWHPLLSVIQCLMRVMWCSEHLSMTIEPRYMYFPCPSLQTATYQLHLSHIIVTYLVGHILGPVYNQMEQNRLATCYAHWHVFTWISETHLAWYQQAVITGREMGAGRSLSHWIIESAVYLQPIKRLIISTELFSVLTQSGWSFALCIAWCSQQWWLI